MSIGVYFKLATQIVRTFTNFYLFVYWKPTRNVQKFTHCCLLISNPCARCEIYSLLFISKPRTMRELLLIGVSLFISNPRAMSDKIERRFRRLQQQATVKPLQDFCSYIDENWIISQTFPPQNWSVFLEAVRTNNDLEGWHNDWTGAPKDDHSCPCKSWSRYFTGKLHWSACRFVWFQTKSWRDISGQATGLCREDSMTSGVNTKTA